LCHTLGFALYEKIRSGGTMNGSGAQRFGMVTPLKDAPDMAASLLSQALTADPTGAVKPVAGLETFG